MGFYPARHEGRCVCDCSRPIARAPAPLAATSPRTPSRGSLARPPLPLPRAPWRLPSPPARRRSSPGRASAYPAPDDVVRAVSDAASAASSAALGAAPPPPVADALAQASATLRALTAAVADVDVDVDAMQMWRLESALRSVAESNPALAGALAGAITAGVSLFLSRAAGVGGDAAEVIDSAEAPVAVPAGLPVSYDVAKIRAYWRRRPLASLKRTSALLARLAGWAAGFLSDLAAGEATVERNAPKRAAALRDLIAEQGPAFVKVGQAVAIRPDLLPPAYLEALQTLLDQVAPFDSAQAKALVKQQLGPDVALEDVFENPDAAFAEPVAAASIGQVYRATLRAADDETAAWGRDVAVKVQRPGILETVTLDLLVIRSVLEAVAALPGREESDRVAQMIQSAEGFIPVLDVAAERFLEELDYGLEAANASRFEADMLRVDVVRGAVKVPHVFRKLSGRCVLTQEWVEGRKLTDLDDDPASAPLRAKLVQTLLNSYMVQFLETGFLHADPHPGNFLLMEDGRLCILDYGMMTTIEAEQRVAFIEYIAHLSARDYDKTLGDLVNLGFVPPELANDPANREIVVPVLAETLETLYGSGGSATKKLDKLNEQGAGRVAELSDKLERIAKDYPLQLPPYFVLILRAFGTLEGLGLSVDENYAIVDECFPYVARRMLADDSPRMRAALRSFVYGGSDRLKVSRVRSIAAGFSEFTNNMGENEATARRDAEARKGDEGRDASSSVRLESIESSIAGSVDPATRDALALVFSAEGNYLQEILVEESVRAADALARNAAASAWRALSAASPAAAALGVLAPPLALTPGVNLPIVLSLLAGSNGGAIALTLDDKRNLALLRSVAELASPEFAARLRRAESSAGGGFGGGTVGGFGVPRGGALGAGGSSGAGGSFVDPEEVRRVVGLVRDLGPTVEPGVRRMGGEFATKLAKRLAERSREDLAALPGAAGANRGGGAASPANELLAAFARNAMRP